MRIISKDNFFNNPNEVRDIALSLNDWILSEDGHSYGWKGKRTQCLSKYRNYFLDRITQNIFDYVWDKADLDNWRYPRWDDGQFSNNHAVPYCKIRNPSISTYFHISTESSKHYYADWQNRYHMDFMPCAGVIYLNPNPPSNSGTSIIDAYNNKFINMENEYNKLVAYDGYYIHGPSNFFGDSEISGRMTLNFFIHEKLSEQA